MLGKGIEIYVLTNKKDEPNLFYIKELSYGIKNVDNLRPPTAPIVGMDKIRAKGWKAFFIDYASSSSVHGVNHLAAPNRHIIERILAVMFIIGGLTGLIFLSLYFWNKYEYNATNFVLDHDFHNFNIIQPSIIVCSVNGLDSTKIPKVFEKYGIEDTEEMRYFFSVISRQSNGFNDTLPKNVNIPSHKWLSILNDLKDEILYASKEISSLAEWIITDAGFCQAIFNNAAPYSSYDYWKSNNWTVVDSLKDRRYCEYLSGDCSTVIDIRFMDVFFGIVYVNDIIDFDGNKYYLKTRHSAKLSTEIENIISTNNLRELSPKQRNCRFRNENILKMWPIYSFAMCRSECRCRQTLKICGCHHHFTRPIPGIPICNLTQLRCIYENNEKITEFNEEIMEECGCVSDCNDIRYIEDEYSNYLTSSNAPKQSAMTIKVKFPTDKYIREEVFGFIDFLAAVGGSAGLLLGASILSFIEFIYFGTLKCFWYHHKIRKE